MRKLIFSGLCLGAGLLPLAAAHATDLTLFNQGASVVTQTRDVDLKKGAQTLNWSDLPEQIMPQTLLLQGRGVRLLGSRYLSGGLNAQALLERKQGQSVTLLRGDGQGGDVKRTAQLVSAGRPLIVRVDDQIEILDAQSPWRVALASVPSDLAASPTLALRVNSNSAARVPLRLTYQVNGLQWSGEYVGRYDDNAKTLDLLVQAVLRNNSGGDFKSANIDLIAGDIAREGSGGHYPVMARAEAFKSDAAPSQSPAFEYHRYALPGKVTLNNGETQGVTLFEAKQIKVKREYRISGGWRSDGNVQRTNADIRVSFDNNLDKPLPAGAVRVYDASSSPLLLGEDQIGHTAEDQPVNLTLGRAFDISAERRVTEQTREGQTQESERRIVVSNAKDESVQVKIIESLPGDWEILSESLPHTQQDANRAVWVLGVPAGGKAVLNYRVRYR